MPNTVRIVDSVPIGYYPNDAGTFIDALAKFDGEDVVIEISNLGGDVPDALKMHYAIKKHSGKTQTRYFGMVASSATIIGNASDEIEMDEETGMLLIHKVSRWVDVWGQMDEEGIDAAIEKLKSIKSTQQKINILIANLYAKRTGKDKDDLLAIMKKDDWLTSSEALELGLIDNTFTPSSEDSNKYNNYDFSQMVAIASKHNLPIPSKRKSKSNNIMSLLDKTINFFKETFNLSDNEAKEKANEFVNAQTANFKAEIDTAVKTAIKAEIDTFKNELKEAKAEIAAFENSFDEKLKGFVKADDFKNTKQELNTKIGEVHNSIGKRQSKNNGKKPFEDKGGNEDLAFAKLGKFFSSSEN